MLKAKNRLKKKKEFAYIYRKNNAFYSKYLTLYTASTKSKSCKIGFSVSNKVGNSVVRHKIKRRLSEIVRKQVNSLPVKNYIFVAKINSDKLSFSQLEKEVDYLLKKVDNEKSVEKKDEK